MNLEKLNPSTSPEWPGFIFLHNKPEYAVVKVTDASNFTHDEEIKFKQKHTKYSVTQPAGKYFLLTIEEINFEKIPDNNADAISFYTEILGKAGVFWHDYYLISQN
jgi:hypothetical protein